MSKKGSGISPLNYTANGTLTVGFGDGNIYSYARVPPGVAAGFFAAGSKGAYFNANIRDIYPASPGIDAGGTGMGELLGLIP